jgi:hypothetical protein
VLLGRFAGLIYDDPQTASGFQSNRCGFMSEAAHGPASR